VLGKQKKCPSSLPKAVAQCKARSDNNDQA
jgi:hypothetical protein